MSKCELCGEPMPQGEEMFKYHGYSGPCPKPPLRTYDTAVAGPEGYDIARSAYKAYSASTGNKNFRGDPMPEFEPEYFGFRKMPVEFNDHWGNGEKWYKVTEKSGSAFWFTVCRRVNPDGRDDRWKIYTAVATNDATGLKTTSVHTVFMGCITTQQFAESLLVHVMGTCENSGINHGRRRLEAAFLE